MLIQSLKRGELIVMKIFWKRNSRISRKKLFAFAMKNTSGRNLRQKFYLKDLLKKEFYLRELKFSTYITYL
ncbi:hypothetical protein RHJ71_19025 [Clostridioides difficile]|nr:hypothetical protein [Clostridioides difficile]